MTKSSTAPTEKLPFLKHRVFDLIVTSVSLIVIVALLLRIPFSADAYDSRLTPTLMSIFAVVTLAVVMMLRQDAIRLAKYQKKVDYQPGQTEHRNDPENTFFYRWFFIWSLPLLAFIALLPWIIAGVFTTEDMGLVSVLFFMFLGPWMAALMGVLIAAMVLYPVEATIRGGIRLIRTGGKEGGQFYVGVYLLIIVGVIIFGSMAVEMQRSGAAGIPEFVAALLGFIAPEHIKSELSLWITRGLVVLAVGIPVVVVQMAKRKDNAKGEATPEVNTSHTK